MSTDTWLETIKNSALSQTATWLVAFLVAILGLFSGRITESIKFALNSADLRTKQYEELAIQISEYIFSAELNTEFIENGWTTKQTMTELLTEYNRLITAIRKNEFVYLAWITKYWGKNEAKQFESFMKSVRQFDAAIHSLNDEFEAINVSASKTKIDKVRCDEVLKKLKPAVEELRKHGRQILTTLA